MKPWDILFATVGILAGCFWIVFLLFVGYRTLQAYIKEWIND